MTLPAPTGYVHPSGHSHHNARRHSPPRIEQRSDEQYAAELAERMRRIREREAFLHAPECAPNDCRCGAEP